MFRQLKILNDVNKTSDKYNILTFNTHERYQTQVAKTGHNFYAFNFEGGKDWYEGHAPMPENYYQLPKNSMYPGVVFDFIFVNSKFGQFQTATKINRRLQLPILSLEHTLPIPSWPAEQLNAFKSMRGDVDVFITEYSKQQWGMPGEVVRHSIDTNLFCPPDIDEKDVRLDRVLTVAHDFVKRDYALNYKGWERITEGIPRDVVGDTPGLSQQSESVEDLIQSYQAASVYINPSTLSPVPTSMLEAMACGCAVVSTATCEIPKIIENGKNGFISNDEGELRSYVKMLLEEPELARTMGRAARQTIKDQFSEERYIKEWNNIFDTVAQVRK
jgi:glycosyltransferase involved in cell wall biosynthesis